MKRCEDLRCKQSSFDDERVRTSRTLSYARWTWGGVVVQDKFSAPYILPHNRRSLNFFQWHLKQGQIKEAGKLSHGRLFPSQPHRGLPKTGSLFHLSSSPLDSLTFLLSSFETIIIPDSVASACSWDWSMLTWSWNERFASAVSRAQSSRASTWTTP